STKSTTENITELAENVFCAETTTEAATAAHTTFKGLMAHTVVHAALFTIREHFIGLCCFFEFLFSFSIVRVTVWMIFHRQLTVGFFDFIINSGFNETQNLIIITFSHVWRCSTRNFV